QSAPLLAAGALVAVDGGFAGRCWRCPPLPLTSSCCACPACRLRCACLCSFPSLSWLPHVPSTPHPVSRCGCRCCFNHGIPSAFANYNRAARTGAARELESAALTHILIL